MMQDMGQPVVDLQAAARQLSCRYIPIVQCVEVPRVQ